MLRTKLILSAGAILIAGAVIAQATGAFFTSAATSTGNVFTAGTLTLQLAPDNNGTAGSFTSGSIGSPATLASNWNFSTMAPGGTPQTQTIWLENSGSIDAAHLGISATNSNVGNGDHGTFDGQVRITKLTLGGSNLLVGGAGATIPTWVTPTNCTITMSGSQTLTSVIANAPAGSVICATGSNYNTAWEGGSTIPVQTSNITIESVGGPSQTATEPFDVTGSNVTIKGFTITDPNATHGVYIHSNASAVTVSDNVLTNIGTTLASGQVQAIDLEPTSAGSNYVFTGNTITNIGNTNTTSGSNKGIYIGNISGTSAVTGATIENNIISNVQAGTHGAYGILLNNGAGVSGAIVMNNSISDLSGAWQTGIGLEAPTLNASVTLNDIHDLGAGDPASTGVTIQMPNNEAGDITISQNNFTPNVAVGIQNADSATVNGQNNWWGTSTPTASQTSGSVNTVNPATGPFAGSINGDPDHNGYADLYDLSVAPGIVGATGLKAGAIEPLVIGVQLDGPTTDNSYQGETMDSALTFTLSQN